MKQKILTAAVVSALLSPGMSGAFEIKASGQINPMVAFGGDVEERTFSDNTMSGSRFRFTAKKEIKPGIDAGLRYEIQFQPTRSFDLNDEQTDVRYAEGYISGKFGKVSLGQGDSGANGSADAVYHNGNYWGSANVLWLGLEGVFDAYRTANGLAAANLFRGGFDSGQRRQRLRYDSPELSGFTVHASLNSQDSTDLAVRHKLRFGEGHKIRSRLGYVDWGNQVVSGVMDNEFTVASVLYENPTGIRVGAAAGKNDADSTQDYEHFTVSYKGDGWTVSADHAENDANQEVTVLGANYSLGEGVTLYFTNGDFKNPDFKGSLFGMHMKF